MDNIMKWLIRILIVLSLIYTFKINYWIGAIGGLIFLIITFAVDYIINRYFKIKKNIIALIYFYCIFSLVMGSMWNFYDKIKWWDTAMHILSGIVLVIIGNVILENYLHNQKISPIFRFLFIVGIACLGGVLWEIYEFIGDSLFNLNMQRASTTGVSDTMKDLISDLLGSIIAGFFLVKIKKN